MRKFGLLWVLVACTTSAPSKTRAPSSEHGTPENVAGAPAAGGPDNTCAATTELFLKLVSESLDSGSNATLRKIQQKHPSIQSFRIQEVPTDSVDYPTKIAALATDDNGTTFTLGTLAYSLKNHAASCNVDVVSDYRNFGLNKLLVLQVLRDHPDINRLDASLFDLNEAVFVNSANLEIAGPELSAAAERFMNSEDYRSRARRLMFDEIQELHESDEVINYRSRLIDAYFLSPAGKVRASVGFGKLEALNIMVDKGGFIIEAKVARGASLNKNEVSVVLVTDGKRKEISAVGKIMNLPRTRLP